MTPNAEVRLRVTSRRCTIHLDSVGQSVDLSELGREGRHRLWQFLRRGALSGLPVPLVFPSDVLTEGFEYGKAARHD
jgi:hypothetical protein